MTLALELSQIQDVNVRRALEQIALHFPVRSVDAGYDLLALGVVAPTRAKVSWGAISAAGAIQAGSPDFTITKGAAGLYTVNWNTTKAGVNYLIDVSTDNQAGANTMGANWRVRAAASFAVTTFTIAGPTAADTQWTFVVIDAQ